MFASVLVGVAVAAGGHLLWLQPGPDDTRVLTASEPRPGGAQAGGVPVPSTTTATSSEEPSPTPTTEPTTSTPDTDEAQDEPTTSSQTSSPPPDTESSTPTTDSTTSTTPDGAENPTGSAQEQVVELVNAERAKAGCAAVRVDDRLVASAQGHSDDMAAGGYLSHTSRDGRSFDDRIEDAGYPSPAAENIAMGMSSAEAVMDAWMSSDGHRRNILNCDITAIGVGLNPDGWYWTQNFGY